MWYLSMSLTTGRLASSLCELLREVPSTMAATTPVLAQLLVLYRLIFPRSLMAASPDPVFRLRHIHPAILPSPSPSPREHCDFLPHYTISKLSSSMVHLNKLCVLNPTSCAPHVQSMPAAYLYRLTMSCAAIVYRYSVCLLASLAQTIRLLL